MITFLHCGIFLRGHSLSDAWREWRVSWCLICFLFPILFILSWYFLFVWREFLVMLFCVHLFFYYKVVIWFFCQLYVLKDLSFSALNATWLIWFNIIWMVKEASYLRGVETELFKPFEKRAMFPHFNYNII